MDIKIISDQKDYLVINKPAGLVVHGGKGIKEKTLSDWLIENYPEITKVGDDPERPGIVHRLDKEVSGLMLIAKNNEAFDFFKNQFKKRKVKKEYIALACGKIEKDVGIIDFPIKRSAKGFKMAAIPKPQAQANENGTAYTPLSSPKPRVAYSEAVLRDLRGWDDKEGVNKTTNGIINARTEGNLKALEKSRQAITEFQVIKRFINFTLIRVNIKTGRTHQIRVHFFAYDCPLLGDNLYSNKKSKKQNQKIKPDRIFLIADTLGFEDLEGNWQEFKIEMDEDLKNILEKIK